MLWSIRQNAGEVVPRAGDTPWYFKCHGVLPGPRELEEMGNRSPKEVFVTVAQLFDVLGLAEVRENVAGFPYFRVYPSSVHCDRLIPLVAHFVAQCSMGRPIRADAGSFQLRSVPWTVPRTMGPFQNRFEDAPIEYEGYFSDYYAHFLKAAHQELRDVARFRSRAQRSAEASGSSSAAAPPPPERPPLDWWKDSSRVVPLMAPRASPGTTSTGILLATTTGPPELEKAARRETASDRASSGEPHSDSSSFPGVTSSVSPGSPRSSLFDSPTRSE